jgi:hypothetical protein
MEEVMNRKRITSIAIALFAVATTALHAEAAKPAKHHAVVRHGRESSGTVESVNNDAKTFVLDSAGKDQTLYWTDATKVNGGTLAAKEKVTVRWMVKAGKRTATSISIAAPKTAKK